MHHCREDMLKRVRQVAERRAAGEHKKQGSVTLTASLARKGTKEECQAEECKRKKFNEGDAQLGVPSDAANMKGFKKLDLFHLRCYVHQRGLIKSKVPLSCIKDVNKLSEEDKSYLGKHAWPEQA